MHHANIDQRRIGISANDRFAPKGAGRRGFALTLRHALPINSTTNSRIWIRDTFAKIYRFGTVTAR